jgi:GntR family transcriptional regulator
VTDVPKNERIAADLRGQIRSGEIPPGGRLPSQPQLMKTYNAAIGTVTRALRQLTHEGLVRSQQGKGTYAVDVLPDPEAPPPDYDELYDLVVKLAKEVQRLHTRLDNAGIPR